MNFFFKNTECREPYVAAMADYGCANWFPGLIINNKYP